jgi:uncharacterized protein YqjF (DUF2071 family)
MTGRLGECVLLAYSTPADTVRHLLPPPLELVRRDGRAFWSVVACRVESIRPRGVPAVFGLTYHHVAYRLYVRAAAPDGGAIEGLYFVRSDVDRAPLTFFGNLVSDFRFHTTGISLAASEDEVNLRVTSADGADARLRARLAANPSEPVAMLKYRPIALSSDRRNHWLKLAEVARDEAAWRETALDVIQAEWSFLNRLDQTDLRLESATRVAPIDYVWRLGRRVAVVAARANGSTSAPSSASFPACSTTSGRG